MVHTTLPLEVFTQRNFVADFIQLNLNFIHKTTYSLFEPPVGGVRGNVCTLRLSRYKQILVKVGVSQRGWVILSANFMWKNTLPANLCWCQKTRVIALSCGIKILAVCVFVSSHSTRVTDRQTGRQNYDH